MIAMVYEEPARTPRVYDERDLPWIARLLDIVEQSVGEPWRVLVERVEHAPLGVHPAHRAAMLQALRRVIGGGGRRARIAQRARTLVLGPPAVDPALGQPIGPTLGPTLGPTAVGPGERAARLATAAATLGTTADDVESLLPIDLTMARSVVLPEGRPAETALAALANLERIQRCARRAHALELRIGAAGEPRAHALIRAVGRRGLIAQVRRDGDALRVHIVGPLALPHSTIVYGRALAALVPLLAEHPRFALDIHCRLGGEDTRLRVAPPLWLPPVADAQRRAPSAADHLAEDLAALGHVIAREPAPIASGEHLVFPDLALDRGGARWFVEVLGFSTREALAARFERYRAAGIATVVLCADLATAPGCDLVPGVCGFTRRVEVDELLATIAASEAMLEAISSAAPEAAR